MKKDSNFDFLLPGGFSTTLSKNELVSVLEGARMGIQDTLQMHSLQINKYDREYGLNVQSLFMTCADYCNDLIKALDTEDDDTFQTIYANYKNKAKELESELGKVILVKKMEKGSFWAGIKYLLKR